jgi:peroxiredoxin
MRTDIAAGAVFPDCELTDHTGKHRKFSDLQGPDPMILALSELVSVQKIVGRQKVEFQREMEVGYCRLITISTDNLATTNEYRTGVGVDWTFLSDGDPRCRRISR